MVIKMEVNPLSIILVKSDSKGDRLLFRYPYRVESNEIQSQIKRRNPYSIPAQEDILQSPPPQTSNIHQGLILTIPNQQIEICQQFLKSKICEKFQVNYLDSPMKSYQHYLLSKQNFVIKSLS